MANLRYSQSPGLGHIFLYKVKSHAGIAGTPHFEMNVQTPLPVTKPATAIISLLKQQSTMQTLVAIPSLIQHG